MATSFWCYSPTRICQRRSRRPALIVQADALQTGLHQTIVAMISSNMTRAGHPCRVTVLQASSEGRQMGLRTDSIVMADNLATVREEEIDRAIGSCPVMDRVAAAPAVHARDLTA